MKFALPGTPIESLKWPLFGTVTITTPSRLTSILLEVAPLQVRRDVFIPPTFLPRALSVIGPAVGVGVGVGVPLVTAARISTRPQPKTLFGIPVLLHWVVVIGIAAL